MNREERPIVFTISQITRNFGGLFEIKTKNPNGKDFNKVCPDEVGITQLYTTLEEISEDLNDKGYAVLFEVD